MHLNDFFPITIDLKIVLKADACYLYTAVHLLDSIVLAIYHVASLEKQAVVVLQNSLIFTVLNYEC